MPKRQQQQVTMASKRPRSVSLTCGETCLILTEKQLRELWNYDNECGSNLMKGCPLRTCTIECTLGGNDATGVQGLTPEEMVLVKHVIKEMWEKASTLFEIFLHEDDAEAGFGMRVKRDLAMKVSIRENDAVPFGWIAIIPNNALSAHVYKRSPIAPSGYLGGPISCLNWCPTNKQNVLVQRSIRKNRNHICNLWTNRPLNAGTEVKWDYGCGSYMPDSGVWFKKECCRVLKVGTADLKRHEHHLTYRSFVFRESCVLCGFPYSISNKESRAQRKQHLAGAHADFLGSEWNGTGIYMQETVDPDVLFLEVDKLNFLLTSLKQMNWNVIPASQVFTNCELEAFGADENGLLGEFHRRFDILKSGGTLVLRGTEVPTSSADFQPIPPSKWRILSWKNKVKPPSGRYASQSKEPRATLEKFFLAFCKKNLKHISPVNLQMDDELKE